MDHQHRSQQSSLEGTFPGFPALEEGPQSSTPLARDSLVGRDSATARDCQQPSAPSLQDEGSPAEPVRPSFASMDDSCLRSPSFAHHLANSTETTSHAKNNEPSSSSAQPLHQSAPQLQLHPQLSRQPTSPRTSRTTGRCSASGSSSPVYVTRQPRDQEQVVLEPKSAEHLLIEQLPPLLSHLKHELAGCVACELLKDAESIMSCPEELPSRVSNTLMKVVGRHRPEGGRDLGNTCGSSSKGKSISLDGRQEDPGSPHLSYEAALQLAGARYKGLCYSLSFPPAHGSNQHSSGSTLESEEEEMFTVQHRLPTLGEWSPLHSPLHSPATTMSGQEALPAVDRSTAGTTLSARDGMQERVSTNSLGLEVRPTRIRDSAASHPPGSHPVEVERTSAASAASGRHGSEIGSANNSQRCPAQQVDSCSEDSEDIDPEDPEAVLGLLARRQFPALAAPMLKLLMAGCTEAQLIKAAADNNVAALVKAVSTAVDALVQAPQKKNTEPSNPTTYDDGKQQARQRLAKAQTLPRQFTYSADAAQPVTSSSLPSTIRILVKGQSKGTLETGSKTPQGGSAEFGSSLGCHLKANSSPGLDVTMEVTTACEDALHHPPPSHPPVSCAVQAAPSSARSPVSRPPASYSRSSDFDSAIRLNRVPASNGPTSADDSDDRASRDTASGIGPHLTLEPSHGSVTGEQMADRALTLDTVKESSSGGIAYSIPTSGQGASVAVERQTTSCMDEAAVTMLELDVSTSKPFKRLGLAKQAGCGPLCCIQ